MKISKVVLFFIFIFFNTLSFAESSEPNYRISKEFESCSEPTLYFQKIKTDKKNEALKPYFRRVCVLKNSKKTIVIEEPELIEPSKNK